MVKNKIPNGGFDMRIRFRISSQWLVEYWISSAIIGVFPFLVLDGHIFFRVYVVTTFVIFGIQLAIAKRFVVKWPALLATFNLSIAALVRFGLLGGYGVGG